MATKRERLGVRVTREHKRLIEKAAEAAGQAVTVFILSAALERARETLSQESRTVLSKRDWEAFVQVLDGAEPPAPALVRAFKRARNRDGR